MIISSRTILWGILMGSFVEAMTPTITPANEYDRHRRHEVEWRQGHWTHDRRGGRLGWWWVVGPSWYYYPQPHSFVMPPPIPETIVIRQAAPIIIEQPPVAPPPPPAPPPGLPVIYYCRATGTNYPETLTCPGGWSTMTAVTPPQQ